MKKDMCCIVLVKMNGKNSMKMVRNKVIITTESFGFMNLSRLGCSCDRKVGTCYTCINLTAISSHAVIDVICLISK